MAHKDSNRGRPIGRVRGWTVKRLSKALAALAAEPYLPVRQAAMRFGIPVRTLQWHKDNPRNLNGARP